MFKKHKQLITGFILGAIVFGTMPVQAKVQEYLLQKSTAKVMVDGQEFANKELPVMNYKGYNYIPMATFREICDNIGVGFEWVGESSEVQISTGKNTEKKPIQETVKPVEEKKGESMVDVKKDGYELTIVDGVEYVSMRDIMKKHTEYEFRREDSIQVAYLAYKPNPTKPKEDQDIVMDNIEVFVIEGLSHIKYETYKENILPLIKE